MNTHQTPVLIARSSSQYDFDIVRHLKSKRWNFDVHDDDDASAADDTIQTITIIHVILIFSCVHIESCTMTFIQAKMLRV